MADAKAKKGKKAPKAKSVPKKKKAVKKPKKKGSAVLTRHKQLLKEIEGNRGKGMPSVRKAAMALGYSANYANSGNLQKTASWKNLLKEFLPDHELGAHHNQLLNTQKIEYQIFPAGMKDEDIIEIIEIFGFYVMTIKKSDSWKRAYYGVPDPFAKRSALDMAYKLKNKYEEKIKVEHKYDGLSKAELIKKVAERVSGHS